MSLHARLAGLIALTVALALLVQGLFGYLDFRRSVLRHVNAVLNSYLTALAHDRATGTYPNAIESESSIRARLVQGGRTLQEYGGRFRPSPIRTATPTESSAASAFRIWDQARCWRRACHCTRITWD